MNTPTPAEMEMARKCARRFIHARYGYSINRIKLAEMINAGEFDDEREIQSALAAIRATTEAAAALVERECKTADGDLQEMVEKRDRAYSLAAATCIGMSNAAQRLAAQIRANHHIKGSDDV